jgi:hypothetical protein
VKTFRAENFFGRFINFIIFWKEKPGTGIERVPQRLRSALKLGIKKAFLHTNNDLYALEKIRYALRSPKKTFAHISLRMEGHLQRLLHPIDEQMKAMHLRQGIVPAYRTMMATAIQENYWKRGKWPYIYIF